jgi:cell migration-inducing and hyaluronan-binding protein
MFDRNIDPNNTFGVTGSAHMPKEDPADPNSESVESVFEDLTTYKNRNGGIWGRGEVHTFRNVTFADNAMGYTHATGSRGRDLFTSRVVDSLFVGETENIGNPMTPEEIAYGRSLPKPTMPDFPIRGYEYYDYRHDVENTSFVNYEDNATRKTGALSYLMYTSAGISTENAIEGATFIDAKPVYFPPTVRDWGNDNGSGIAWNTAVLHDKDGSVGGIPNSYILINDGVYDSIATDAQACEIRPAWNAAVCRGDIGRLSFGGASGVDYGAPGIGPPRGRGAAPEPPVVLSRNDRDFALTRNQSNIRAGIEIKVSTESPEVSIGLWEMDEGSWVIFELPGFATAASGTELGGLDALRQFSGTSYFKDQDALWVKLVSGGDGARGPIGGGLGGGTSIRVSR